MSKIKKLVQTAVKYTINTVAKVFCTDISSVVSGATGDTITHTATFPTTYNGLKAVFLTKIPADATSTTEPSLTGYNIIGSATIIAGSASLVQNLAEWSNMSVTAYVVPATNTATANGTADLA